MISALLAHDQRSMQGDQVSLCIQFFFGNIGQKAFIHQSLVGESIPADDSHAIALADLCEDLADTAGTDDTCYLVVQVDAQKSVQSEVVVLDLCISLVDAAVCSLDDGHGMLGNGIRRICRYTNNRNAIFLSTLLKPAHRSRISLMPQSWRISMTSRGASSLTKIQTAS